MSCEKREESSSLKTHDDPLTCFQEENASVAERNSMKRIPGRSSRDFLATRKERSKGKKGEKKEKAGKERERRGIKLQKSKGKRDSRHYWKRAERRGEGKRGKKGQEAAKAEQERRLKASAG